MSKTVYNVSNRLLGDVNVDGSINRADLTAATASIGKKIGQADGSSSDVNTGIRLMIRM
jgi:hypothetical protein